MTSSLYIAPFSLYHWYVYLDWFKQRDEPLPYPPKQMILIADEDTDELLGGACVYPTEGPWMFMEHVTFKPGLDNNLILRGVRLGVEAAKGLGASVGKRPVIHSSRRSIDAMLDSCGYTRSDIVCWYTEPTTKGVAPNETIVSEEETKTKRPSARRRKDAKPMGERPSSGDERDSGQ